MWSASDPGGVVQLGSHSNDSRRSELKESQPGYALEVAQICRQHRIAERERGRTDQEIGERNHDAAGLLLASSLPASLAMSVVRG